MTIHVIHDPNHSERGGSFSNEMLRQIGNYTFRFWPAIYDTPTCKGISRAHKQIVHANQSEPELIIMEDDVKIPAKDGLKYFLENKPYSFDLYLSGIYSGGIVGGLTKNFSGLHLYMIRKKFYDTFLNADENKPLDRGLAGKGKFHVCYPFAAIQHDGHSYNTGKVEDYSHYLMGKKIYEGI